MGDLRSGLFAIFWNLNLRHLLKDKHDPIWPVRHIVHAATDHFANRISEALFREGESTGTLNEDWRRQTAEDRTVEIELDVIPHEADGTQLPPREGAEAHRYFVHRMWAHGLHLGTVCPVSGFIACPDSFMYTTRAG